jgi:hypothetical protein
MVGALVVIGPRKNATGTRPAVEDLDRLSKVQEVDLDVGVGVAGERRRCSAIHAQATSQ